MNEHRLIVITNHWPRAELRQRRITPLNANIYSLFSRERLLESLTALLNVPLLCFGPIPRARIALRGLDGESVRERHLRQAFRHTHR